MPFLNAELDLYTIHKWRHNKLLTFFFRSPYLMFNRLHFPDFLTIYNCVDFLCKHKYFIIIHSSEIRDLCLMKFSSSEKPHIFSRNRCHGLFQHRLIMFKKYLMVRLIIHGGHTCAKGGWPPLSLRSPTLDPSLGLKNCPPPES